MKVNGISKYAVVKVPLADAIMDRISYDSYKIDIESIDSSKSPFCRQVGGTNSNESLQTLHIPDKIIFKKLHYKARGDES